MRNTESVRIQEQSIFKPAGETQLIPHSLLMQATKVLFITHYAIGDFLYMQSCFRALKRSYPHLKVHIWVDERRRTEDAAAWPHLKKYAVYDLLDASPYVDKSYNKTYNNELNKKSIEEAQAEDYPIVLTLTNIACHRYARLARNISSRAFIVGLKKTTTRRYDIIKRLSYRKLNASIPMYRSSTYAEHGVHISDVYADWFSRAFGIEISKQERFPIMEIPKPALDYAEKQFQIWNCGERGAGKVVFVNSFSKCKERCWPLERAFGLIKEMKSDPKWQGATFIMNVVPEALERAQMMHQEAGLDRTHLFCAEENFFQLPAILGLCDLIISVETVIMHLANVVKVPVIALMRQATPEWVPIDSKNSSIILVKELEDWIDRLEVADVFDQVQKYSDLHDRNAIAPCCS